MVNAVSWKLRTAIVASAGAPRPWKCRLERRRGPGASFAAAGRRTLMRAIRSFLFAPGNHARRVEKALTLDADAVILDLEDAVATAEKPATREAVVAALLRDRRGLLYARVNALDTEF